MPEDTLKSEELQLEGFHCVDCADTIEKTVAKLNGVHQVKANFASGKVKISYDPVTAHYEDLVRSVERIGYRVKHDAFKISEERNIWQEREFIFTILSGLLLGIGLATHFFTKNPVLVDIVDRGVTASAILFLAAIFFGAYYFSREGWASIKNLRFNMDFLMSLAIVGAVIIEEYVEAASLAFLFSLAELLENYAVERARKSLRELMRLTPDVARIKRQGQEITVPVDEVRIGDILIVRPGERVACDGVIAEGISSLDQSPITGESVPVTKEKGAKVFASSINMEGYLEVRITETTENTMLARIIHLVEEAEVQKAPSERFVDRFAKIYTPTIVAIAIVVATVPPLMFSAVFKIWFIKALTLLVIACPCALVISTPVSVVSALTSASRNGILIKGGVHLEEMANIDVIALDKTGTLTQGRLKVTEVIPVNGKAKEEVLKVAASLEMKSEHPIAKAIVESASGLELEEVRDFEAIPGKGVWAKLNGQKYYVGRPELFNNISVQLPNQELQLLQSQGKTTMLVGTESEIVGMIGLSDQIREEAAETIAKLQASGKEVVMITGDNEETAKAIGKKLGITHFHAGLLPQDKVEEIHFLQQKLGKVAMVGDGINDAPALATANVGIAMGAVGTDTALETADIALMSDDLSKLPYLVELSKRSRGIIKQNIWTSILLKFSLAVGVFPGVVSLVIAVMVGDMGASLAVTSNALRLAHIKAP
ncbi:MAG: heavy metal translocating P-type ATPase [bacterium]